jgi:hypothetical protein
VKDGEARQSSEQHGAVPKAVVTARPNTQVNSSMVWLIGDHNQVRRQQFKDAGWVIGLSSNRSLNKSKRRTLRSRFADDQPHLLYVVNLGGMGDTEDVSSFIAVLMQDQLNLRGLILLEAPESSNVWTLPHGKLTEHRDWHPAVTRWCGLTSQTAKGELSDTHFHFKTFHLCTFELSAGGSSQLHLW